MAIVIVLLSLTAYADEDAYNINYNIPFIPSEITEWCNDINGCNQTTLSLNAGNTVTFNVTVNQTINNVSWKINGAEEQNTSSLEFIRAFGSTGTFNVTAQAFNANGSSNIVYTVVTVVSSGGGGTTYRRVGGYVKYPNGTAVESAAVVTTQGTESTDGTGHYQFGYVFVDGQSYWFNVSKAGHTSNNTYVLVNTEEQVHNATIDLNITAPGIISTSPATPTFDAVNATRTFSATWNQTVNVTWYLNGTEIRTNTSITTANYTNTSASEGVWNITVIGTNSEGSASFTWIWNVNVYSTISGAIIGSDGFRVPNATVKLASGDPATEQDSTVTDANGNYSFNTTETSGFISATKFGYISNASSEQAIIGVTVINLTLQKVPQTPMKAPGFGVLAGLAAIILCLVVRRRRK